MIPATSSDFRKLLLKITARVLHYSQNSSRTSQGFFRSILQIFVHDSLWNPSRKSLGTSYMIVLRKPISEFHQDFNVNSFQNSLKFCPENFLRWKSWRNHWRYSSRIFFKSHKEFLNNNPMRDSWENLRSNSWSNLQRKFHRNSQKNPRRNIWENSQENCLDESRASSS